MLRLSKTTQTLAAVLTAGVAANQPQVAVSFFDLTPQKTVENTRGSNQLSNLNDTTVVTILSAPTQNFVRHIEAISIYNKDTSNVEITIKITDNGVDYILIKRTIATKETLFYESSSGWGII